MIRGDSQNFLIKKSPLVIEQTGAGGGANRKVGINKAHPSFGELSQTGSVLSVPEGVFVPGSAMPFYKGSAQSNFTESSEIGQVTLGFETTPGATVMLTYFLTGSRTIACTGPHPVWASLVGAVDGINRTFSIPSGRFKPGSTIPYYRGQAESGFLEGAGLNSITFNFAPTAGSRILLEYEEA